MQLRRHVPWQAEAEHAFHGGTKRWMLPDSRKEVAQGFFLVAGQSTDAAEQTGGAVGILPSASQVAAPVAGQGLFQKTHRFPRLLAM